jgi:hypothetical protein
VTFNTTAAEIAAEWAEDGTDARTLELEILRHMEHHVLKAVAAEREACAKIAEEYGERQVAHPDVGEWIAEKIRARP